MNKFTVREINIKHGCITYRYDIFGDWISAFNEEQKFSVEYNCDVSNVPNSVAIIPLIANVLPIAWLYDAEIEVPDIDSDFYNSIPNFKRGYEEMYPMLKFGGRINAAKISPSLTVGTASACFFSGGVDAFDTFFRHVEEKPALITVWGADIKLTDRIGWDKVEAHLREVTQTFGVAYYTIKSSFRLFIKEGELSKKVQSSGDGWWHGFQHGLGMYSHGAPLAYKLGLNTFYFASSFTAKDKGKVTCASDPSIDNYVKFCGASVSHDGYECNRQMKIKNITTYARQHNMQVPLRVCWQSAGGGNCNNCEKCWRTILGIYAEGCNPEKFGMQPTDQSFLKLRKEIASGNPLFRQSHYQNIQVRMKENVSQDALPNAVRWFYDFDVNKIGNPSTLKKIYRKLLMYMRRVKHRLACCFKKQKNI